jgi:D-alanyl-D-alanine carboxypeptidase
MPNFIVSPWVAQKGSITVSKMLISYPFRIYTGLIATATLRGIQRVQWGWIDFFSPSKIGPYASNCTSQGTLATMVMRSMNSNLSIIGIITVILIAALMACQNVSPPQSTTFQSEPTSKIYSPTIHASTRSVKNSDMSTPSAPMKPPASTTPNPTSTKMPEPTATATPTTTPSPTPIGPCVDRIPADGGLALVTLEFGISREYVPPDLVNLSDHIPITVTLGYPSQVREIVIEPLTQLINDMLEADLQPQIISGYRSYASQAIAWNKWLKQIGDRASIVSAPPGHSEHQLGTTVDFGSPELALIVGDEDVKFHTYFYKTSESHWLEENAHKYGFTLSFTRETFDISGLYYEPWHYRYVGREFAEFLKDNDFTLIQFLLGNQEPPCISD